MHKTSFVSSITATLLTLFAGISAGATLHHTEDAHAVPCYFARHTHVSFLNDPCAGIISARHDTLLAYTLLTHNKFATPTHSKPSRRHDRLSQDDLALLDMSVVAARHLGGATGRHHTYGSTTEWEPGWAYRWMEFSHNGRTIRVCHAMRTRDIHSRYATVWDGAHSRWTDWEPMK